MDNAKNESVTTVNPLRLPSTDRSGEEGRMDLLSKLIEGFRAPEGSRLAGDEWPGRGTAGRGKYSRGGAGRMGSSKVDLLRAVGASDRGLPDGTRVLGLRSANECPSGRDALGTEGEPGCWAAMS